jgi:class 3 adenylate cyclase
LALNIPSARYVELAGIDHLFFAEDSARIVAEIQEFITGVRDQSESDRVLATVLFVDIAGSTELSAKMGDRRWQDIIQSFYVAVRAGLARFRETEINTTGDGLFVSFDGPARAIRCGLAICEAVRLFGIEVRIGIHTGECELIGEKIGGIAVHIGARVAALAQPGEVLVSTTVRDLVAGSGLQFEDRGVHTLKGVPGTWPLYAVARNKRL